MEQLTMFDWMPTLKEEPEVGAWVKEHGAVIPHIMRKSYIGKKVVMDLSTESRQCFKVAILEQVLPDFYWHNDDPDDESGWQKVECDRSVLYTGKKGRSYITHMPGREIYECLPWDAYQERKEAIGKRG